MGSTGTASRSSSEFQQFSDMPTGSHEYADNNGKTARWFKENSNFDALISSMSGDDRSAFRTWTEGWFMDRHQWGPWSGLRTDQKVQLEQIENILDRATLSKGVEVARMSTWRLINNDSKDPLTLDQLKAMEGSVIFSRGAMSTAAAKQGLSITWRGGKDDPAKPVEYKIRIPGGSKGAGMWVGDKRINGWGDQQREFLMNRDSYYKVGKSYWDDRRKKTIIELTWIGHDKHNHKD